MLWKKLCSCTVITYRRVYSCQRRSSANNDDDDDDDADGRVCSVWISSALCRQSVADRISTLHQRNGVQWYELPLHLGVQLPSATRRLDDPAVPRIRRRRISCRLWQKLRRDQRRFAYGLFFSGIVWNCRRFIFRVTNLGKSFTHDAYLLWPSSVRNKGQCCSVIEKVIVGVLAWWKVKHPIAGLITKSSTGWLPRDSHQLRPNSSYQLPVVLGRMWDHRRRNELWKLIIF